MKKLILTVLLVSGCAHQHWVRSPQANTNFYAASSTCEMNAQVAVGPKQGNFDFANGINKNRFYSECMRGQGFQLVDDSASVAE